MDAASITVAVNGAGVVSNVSGIDITWRSV